MIALYLFAAHLVGDFVLQTRWQAAGKFTDRALRARHVTTYTLAFVPVLWVMGWGWGGGLFLPCLWVLHYLTDARRFHSTLGDMIAWRRMKAGRRSREWLGIKETRSLKYDPMKLPANPWPTVPIMVDQTLHVIQLAILGGLFLS